MAIKNLEQPINYKFQPHYFHRVKIISTNPLTFEHLYYYKHDVFQVLETGDMFRITNKPKTKGDYLYERVWGDSDLKVGYTTIYVYNTVNNFLFGDAISIQGEQTLRWLLARNDYYYVADLLYDLGKCLEEIPMDLMNFILKTVYE